jgi:RHS repeat-associated protein
VHNNHRGDIVLVRSGTNTVATYEYSAFGELVEQTGADLCRFKFSSKELESGCGLVYYGYRFYSPGMSRWLNRDPIGEAGGVNLYQFVGNVPTSALDPLGLASGTNDPKYPVVLPIDPPAAPTGCPAKASGLNQSFFGPWCRDQDYPHKLPDGTCLECYRSLPGRSGQQCCYDENGDLLPGELGTSPDKVSPASGKDADGNCIYENLEIFIGHIVKDYIPAKFH